MKAVSIEAEPIEYSDAVVAAVETRLLNGGFTGVLVWVDPIAKDGENRNVLNNMLRRVSSHGVQVSTHPDLIDLIGTKAILHITRRLSWGCEDTHLYPSVEVLRAKLFASLQTGPRVLKQLRGSAGDNVWKVELTARMVSAGGGVAGATADLTLQSAGNDTVEIMGSYRELVDRLASFCCPDSADGRAFVDMPYQPRVEEGMLRVYMVRDTPVALLHQLPKPGGLNVSRSGLRRTDGLPEGRKLFTEGHALFDRLSDLLRTEWLPELREALGLHPRQRLPIIWDIDLLFRSSASQPPRPHSGRESEFVLCEINCSCVYPGPPLLPLIAQEVARSARADDGCSFGCEVFGGGSNLAFGGVSFGRLGTREGDGRI